MAQQFLSANIQNLNNNLGNVVPATSAPSADFYFQILTTHSPTREQALLALDMFRNYILSNGFPAGQTGVDLPVL